MPDSKPEVAGDSQRSSDLTLREWLQNSPFRGSISKFAAALGVPYDTVRDWVAGRRSPGPKHLDKLRKVTGFTSFRMPPSAKQTAFQPAEPEGIHERIETVRCLLYALHQQLELFKRGSVAERQLLRQRLRASDVAYVTNLFQVLFEEDRFQDWLIINNSYNLNREVRPAWPKTAKNRREKK